MSAARKVTVGIGWNHDTSGLKVFLTHLVPCLSSPDSRDSELAADLWRKSEEILEMNVEGLMLRDDDDKESVFGISAPGTAQMAK